jgi:hypothetical protein
MTNLKGDIRDFVNERKNESFCLKKYWMHNGMSVQICIQK